MDPLLPPGTNVLVVPCSADNIARGDIAVFRRGKKLIAHRVMDVKIDDKKIMIAERGDASGTVTWRDDRQLVGLIAGIQFPTGLLDLRHGLGWRVSHWLDHQWSVRRSRPIFRKIGFALVRKGLPLLSVIPQTGRKSLS